MNVTLKSNSNANSEADCLVNRLLLLVVACKNSSKHSIVALIRSHPHLIVEP
ncbi:hypothetical protein HanPSC8_Chr12g0508281 [Helianthus annuus]|nr:hypothetical protein HanPSC8_Chr12g0508281 [Helianthus annuus]